jgi:hypothetical protein
MIASLHILSNLIIHDHYIIKFKYYMTYVAEM